MYSSAVRPKTFNRTTLCPQEALSTSVLQENLTSSWLAASGSYTFISMVVSTNIGALPSGRAAWTGDTFLPPLFPPCRPAVGLPAYKLNQTISRKKVRVGSLLFSHSSGECPVAECYLSFIIAGRAPLLSLSLSDIWKYIPPGTLRAHHGVAYQFATNTAPTCRVHFPSRQGDTFKVDYFLLSNWQKPDVSV
jgi:hypothetical protein